MKKAISTKRLTKRKTNKDILLLKNFSAEVESSKDILQVLQEKLLQDSQSVWFGADILYVVESVKRGKVVFDKAPQTNATVKVSKPPKSKSYVVVLKRKDATINVLLLSLKDGDLELKSNSELKFLRAIDFGSEDNEVLLSFDSGDLNVFLASQTDRDEALWVMFQICKCIIGNEVSVGYSVDIEAISFKTSTNSTLARFPVLNKLISAKNILTGDVFSDEEAEAEHLLDELNWSAGSSGQSNQQSDLQLLLSNQSDQLKTEIIDFLLQWEEMDEVQSTQHAPATALAQGGVSAGGLNGQNLFHNIASLNANIKNKMGLDKKAPINPFHASSAAAAAAAGAPAPPAPLVAGVRDTREVLNALSLVENELEAVDGWLCEQIERLSEIKVNLSMIEDESGALETSWKNLNNVQEIINYIVRGYSVDLRYQELLRQSPEAYFGPALKGASIQGLTGLINPLVDALAALRKALDLKTNLNRSNAARLAREAAVDHNSSNASIDVESAAVITPAQWKQLQAISAITTQRTKLSELSELFCKNFGDFSVGIFDQVLKHKALSDPASGTTIVVKQFAFQSLVDEFVLEHLDYTLSDGRADFSKMRMPLKMATQKNQLLQSAKIYHLTLNKLSPLLDIFIELSPTYSRPICDAYVRATNERFYLPLARTLLKDLQNIVFASKAAKISLASCGNFHFEHLKRDDPSLVRFRHYVNTKTPASAKAGISSWMALRVVLIIFAPVLETEEKFMKSFFGNARHGLLDSKERSGQKVSLVNEASSHFASSRLAVMLHAMFEHVVSKIDNHVLKSGHHHHSSGHTSPTPEQIDGIEIIAMLTVLQEFTLMYSQVSPFQSEPVPHDRKVLFEADSNEAISVPSDAPPSPPSALYLLQVLDTFRSSLLTRLHVYVNEQIVWINGQKYDPKSSAVLLPFSRFPTLISQVLEMTAGMQFDHVDDLLHKLAKELFSWLTLTAKQSEKYCDKIKITNFTFFEKAIGPMNIAILENFVTFAAQQKAEAVARYVNWMVSYEFPALSALAVRMDGVGSRVNEEELSLYIRRKDVLNVVKEVENVKVLEANIVTLRKRLEKHFLCESYVELNLVAKGWQQIKNRVVSILSRLEDAASASYQIRLDVGPKVVQDLFDKHSNNTMVL